MQFTFPITWHVMGVRHHLLEQDLWLKDRVILWDHSACDGENRSEDSEVKQHRAVWRDFKVQEYRIYHRDEQKDRGKSAGDEGNESAQEDG
jgi:hypothetical protein